MTVTTTTSLCPIDLPEVLIGGHDLPTLLNEVGVLQVAHAIDTPVYTATLPEEIILMEVVLKVDHRCFTPTLTRMGPFKIHMH